MKNKLGVKIGEGGCAEVFEWMDDNKIVKLAKPNTNVDALRQELHHCQIAWDCGLPVPEPFDLVNIDGRSGAVFERIYGESIMQRFVDKSTERAKPKGTTNEFDDYIDAKITARLLFQIHSHSVLNMPSQRENIKNDILHSQYLTEGEKEAVIYQLDQLPMKQQLCHGDPNPGNILFRDSEAIIIDWNNSSTGNPEADLVEYIIMVRYAILPSDFPIQAKKVLNDTRETSIRIFMDEYERLSGIGYADVEPWIVPIAARKLCADGISEEEKTLLVTEIRRKLHNKRK
ncbi:phosphotransferase [Neobacillus mesonae]|nr:phosphotransferase [Neobacillus mesonae]